MQVRTNNDRFGEFWEVYMPWRPRAYSIALTKTMFHYFRKTLACSFCFYTSEHTSLHWTPCIIWNFLTSEKLVFKMVNFHIEAYTQFIEPRGVFFFLLFILYFLKLAPASLSNRETLPISPFLLHWSVWVPLVARHKSLDFQ